MREQQVDSALIKERMTIYVGIRVWPSAYSTQAKTEESAEERREVAGDMMIGEELERDAGF